MSFVRQLDKGQTRMLSLVADHFIANDDFYHAIEVYQKMGDYTNLALVYMKAGQWDEVCMADWSDQIMTSSGAGFQNCFRFSPTERASLCAICLVVSGEWAIRGSTARFDLLHKVAFIDICAPWVAFFEAGQRNESLNVLNQLLLNSINENRFNDASFYSWLLANYFAQLTEALPIDAANRMNESGHSGADKAAALYKQSDIYYAYHPIYKYIVSTIGPQCTARTLSAFYLTCGYLPVPSCIRIELVR